MIDIEDLSKTFKTKEMNVNAVRDVSLHIADGEIYGIIGYSGAGKSTLVRCINFLETPDSGTVAVKGFGKIEARGGQLFYTAEDSDKEEPLSEKKLQELRRSIGMIFQHFNLLDRSTVFENIAYPLKHTGLTKAEIKERVMEMLKLVDLTEKADSYPSQLSGGQKQRVAIARALANRPKILLSDEATSALDPDATESILALLKDLNQQLGLTIVMITHEMAVIKAVADKVTVMENGKAVEEGDVYDIFSHPQMAITKKFVNSSFGLNGLEQLYDEHSPLVTTGVDSRLVKLTFEKDVVGDALISQVSREYEIDMNIILADVELLKNSPLGNMIVLVKGEKQAVTQALDYLKKCGVGVEVIEHERNS